MNKIEWGAIITLMLAVIGFAFWLGGLQTTVNLMNSGEFIDKKKTEALTEIRQATKVANDHLLKNPIGFIEPINTVLGTPGAQPGSPYIAPYRQVQSYEIPVSVPSGSKLLSVWYVPIDNLPDLPRFGHIEVAVSGVSSIQLRIGGRQGVEGQLRIVIFGIYGPA